ncbi:unnamed protein product [Pedinophyceae sp. YPF-701]|nr:unnamed protein product [Pedinophyceae sp. YPF-701]
MGCTASREAPGAGAGLCAGCLHGGAASDGDGVLFMPELALGLASSGTDAVKVITACGRMRFGIKNHLQADDAELPAGLVSEETSAVLELDGGQPLYGISWVCTPVPCHVIHRGGQVRAVVAPKFHRPTSRRVNFDIYVVRDHEAADAGLEPACGVPWHLLRTRAPDLSTAFRHAGRTGAWEAAPPARAQLPSGDTPPAMRLVVGGKGVPFSSRDMFLGRPVRRLEAAAGTDTALAVAVMAAVDHASHILLAGGCDGSQHFARLCSQARTTGVDPVVQHAVEAKMASLSGMPGIGAAAPRVDVARTSAPCTAVVDADAGSAAELPRASYHSDRDGAAPSPKPLTTMESAMNVRRGRAAPGMSRQATRKQLVQELQVADINAHEMFANTYV